jgi:hypothetical protein
MRVPALPTVVLSALVVGAFAFYVDVHNDEVQPTALILVLGAGVIGATWPKWSWVGGLVSGVCILLGHLIWRASGRPTPFPMQPNVIAALIAVIPAMVGALIGAGARLMLRSAEAPRP